MSGLIQKIFDAVTIGQPKDEEKGKTFVRIDSVEQGHNILKAVEEEQKSGKHQADVEINTAIEADLVRYLNYGISLIDEKYALHKMLLVLRVNPISENPTTGRGVYLSKRFIAQSLTKNLKRVIREDMIDKLEKEAIRICQEAIRKTKETALPLVSGA